MNSLWLKEGVEDFEDSMAQESWAPQKMNLPILNISEIWYLGNPMLRSEKGTPVLSHTRKNRHHALEDDPWVMIDKQLVGGFNPFEKY